MSEYFKGRHEAKRTFAAVVVLGGGLAIGAYLHYDDSLAAGCGLSSGQKVELSSGDFEVTRGTPYVNTPTRFVFNGTYNGKYFQGALHDNEIVHHPIVKIISGGDELIGFHIDGESVNPNSCPAGDVWVDYTHAHQVKQSVIISQNTTPKNDYGYLRDGQVTSPSGAVEAYATETAYVAPGLFKGNPQHTGGVG